MRVERTCDKRRLSQIHSIDLQVSFARVSFAKEPYKRDDNLWKRLII